MTGGGDCYAEAFYSLHYDSSRLLKKLLNFERISLSCIRNTGTPEYRLLP
jgi:hypothetical protein